jgi:FkbM family methyltransferase
VTVITLEGIEIELPERLEGTAIASRLAEGRYETSEAAAVVGRVKPGMKVLEIGAGLGFVSSLCAKIAGAENVVSVEANPDMVPVARANLDRNGFQDTQLLHGAVIDGDDLTSETIRFHAGRAFWGGAVLDGDAHHPDEIEVPILRLRDLLSLHRPRFVVMDIEGAEQYLFDRKWPRHVRFVVLELHLSKYPEHVLKKIVDCMSRSGLTYDPRTSQRRTLGFKRVPKQD